MEKSKRGADLEEGHVSNYGHDQVEVLVRHSNGYYVKQLAIMNLDFLEEMQPKAIN